MSDYLCIPRQCHWREICNSLLHSRPSPSTTWHCIQFLVGPLKRKWPEFCLRNRTASAIWESKETMDLCPRPCDGAPQRDATNKCGLLWALLEPACIPLRCSHRVVLIDLRCGYAFTTNERKLILGTINLSMTVSSFIGWSFFCFLYFCFFCVWCFVIIVRYYMSYLLRYMSIWSIEFVDLWWLLCKVRCLYCSMLFSWVRWAVQQSIRGESFFGKV